MLARHSALAHAPAAAAAHQPQPHRFVTAAPPKARRGAAGAAPRGTAVVCAAKAKRERAAAKSADVEVLTKERPPAAPEAAPEAPEAAPQQPPPAGADAPAMSGMEMLEDEENKASGQGSSSGIASGLRMENVSMAFKNQQVLKDISWEVKKGERVGLVGVNGAGKTTQLQIIMGKLTPDGGNVVKAKKNMKIAYLAQEFDVDLGRTVREEFYSVYEKQMQVVRRQEVISKELESCGDDMDKMQKLIDEMEKLNRRVVDLDVALLDKKIDKMMPELGFTGNDNDRKVRSFSGGWQMRMCLGKMLLQEPDVLLLDEPTNHLDLDAIEWLEKYLKQQEVPMVVVSHDREFLDQLCTKVVETERGVTTTYKGNYTQYVAAKSEATALQWAAWEKQQKEVTKHRELIARLSGGAQSGRAAQAEKALEKLKEEGLIEKPFIAKKRSFTFPPVERMGQKVLTIRGLTHGYETRPLFKNVSLDIEKGDRVAIIGPNGAGKSTLLRLIMGTEQPNEGEVSLGEHNIAPNYFEQNQAEALDLKLTVLETLVRASPEAQLNDLKNLLGRMMFSGSGMDKKVAVLSGGEKARLALAKFMCTEGTLLVLDEPTNHLDIPSKEMLEEAIMQFEGAVIAVSHDRYFLRRIATRVLTVENQTLTDFQGDYDYYLEQNQDEAAVMEEKAARQKQLQQENTKATSKMTKAERTMLKKQKAKEFNEAAAGKGKNAKGKK